MSKRFDNKKLLFILAGLAVILTLTILVKIPKERASIKTRILEIDSTDVASILLYPREDSGKTIEFNKSRDRWMVKQGDIVSASRKDAVQGIFNELMNLKPKQLAANDKSKWKEFELTDSLATRVEFFNGKGKNIAGLMIGKFNFKQVANPYGGYGGGNIQGTTYVRIPGDNEVFAVDGFLTFTFNRKFNEWRDNTFIQTNQGDITRIHFINPGDSSFILAKKDSVWYASDIPADSAATADYLGSLRSVSGQDFKDHFTPSSNPVYQIQIEGNNLLNVNIRCYAGEVQDEYILNSSLNPDVYYTSKRSGLFEQLFKPLNHFLPQRKK
jgi:hypothetical protein